MSEKTKVRFAPLPLRAIIDPRLTTLHFRVLAIIAYHDRMASRRKTGAGCYASHKTLSDKIGCNYTNLSTAISDLGRFGYLERHPHPLNKRLHVYNVIYDDDSLPVGKHSDPDTRHRDPATRHANTVTHDIESVTRHGSLPTGKQNGEIVCPPESQVAEGKEQSSVNIFRETEKRFCRNREGYSRERASTGVDARLAIFERDFRAGKSSKADIRETAKLCQEIIDSYDSNDSAWQRANRLLGEIE